ncbi:MULTISPECIES: FeoA family protein [Clostridium]|uniref:FeoA domain-containing protein n=1 Tax=Clostridium cibarium TaxID=2762247 RepID=A0ABR8PXT1_9CLOT|nr:MULTISPECIES: FeoA family protein [Clostridium]MBD7912968.1 FeoA domain-containing protein [Clostridium cibarium]
MILPMNLADEGKEVEVKSISMKDGLGKRLSELGLISGNKIRIIKNDGRSIIVAIDESRFAIDKSIAQKVMISI